MRRTLPVALACLLAGCPAAPPKLKLSVAAQYDGLACGAVEPSIGSLQARVVRLSARIKDAGGGTTGICDALLSATEAKVEGFPGLGAQSKVDLFVEAFAGDDATQRIASGALFDIDPAGADLPPLRLFESEQYRCVRGGQLAVPRAFHTATELDNHQVLLIGGVTATPDGSDGPAQGDASGNPKLYATSAVELYDPATGSLGPLSDPEPGVPRAFHRTALLGSENGRYTLLLMGGITPATAGVQVLTALGKTPPTGFRMALDDNAAVAPAEILVYDSTTTPPSVTRTRAPMAIQEASAALQAGIELREGGMAVAGGLDLAGGMASAKARLAVTTDGMTLRNAAISQPRYGATMVGLSGELRTPAALLFGGIAASGEMPAPFERLDLTGAPSASPLGVDLPGFPVYLFATVTALDVPSVARTRFLVSGGLELSGTDPSNPPADPTVTMFQVTEDPQSQTLAALPLTTRGFTSGDLCSPSLTHFRAVAFDAAIRLPPGDRVLANGGVPRSGGTCHDCEEEDSLTCGVRQSVMVSIPASASMAPQIAAESALHFGRFGHTLTALHDGNVLVAGGLARRSMQTWAVAQTEIFNPARVTPPAPRTRSGASIEDDDPLHDDLERFGASRDPGGQAFAPQDGSKAPRFPCIQPKK